MKNELNKKFGLITAICMVAGIVIGSGVFFKATPVFTNNGGNMVNSILTVLVVGVLMTTCAYTFSILAGKHSRINGNVTAKDLTCAGVINGDMTIAGNMVLEKTAQVTGNITTGTIAVEKGALIKGGIEIRA